MMPLRKDFFKFILFHLDEGMRFLAKNHVRENLHERRKECKDSFAYGILF